MFCIHGNVPIAPRAISYVRDLTSHSNSLFVYFSNARKQNFKKNFKLRKMPQSNRTKEVKLKSKVVKVTRQRSGRKSAEKEHEINQDNVVEEVNAQEELSSRSSRCRKEVNKRGADDTVTSKRVVVK